MPRRRLLLVAAIAVLAIVAGVAFLSSSDDGDDDYQWATCDGELVGAETTTSFPEPLPAVEATAVATLDAPTDLATRPGDPALYVAERTGTVYRVSDDGALDALFALDPSTEKEQGLLSLTFSPDGDVLYTNHTAVDGTNHVDARPVDADGAFGEPVEILTSDRPRANHNLNELVFGPDGYLYLSSGDGGVEPIDGMTIEAADPDRRALDPQSLFGKILRIDPDPVDGGYTVPDDNPFADGSQGAPEVYALGLRNPWRFSFDRANGDLWLADTGHYCFEEVNHLTPEQASGANLGWSAYEGFMVHNEDQDAPDAELPIHVYPRGDGSDGGPLQCAIIGGFVYRGTAIPDLDGAYLFGDFCAGEVRALRQDGSGAVEVQTLVTDLVGLQSLAEDEEGEIYVLAADGVYRLDGSG